MGPTVKTTAGKSHPKRFGWTAGLACALLFVWACQSLRETRIRPTDLPAESVQAFADARAYMRLGTPASRELARSSARLAVATAPDWVSPRRLLDDLLREDLLGVEAMAAHRRALSDSKLSFEARALESYLAGRMEASRAKQYFRDAAHFDPSLAWAHHGMAFVAEREGRYGEARALQRRALGLARDSWERSFFTSSLARIEASGGRLERAIDLLRDRLAEADVQPADSVQLSVELAQIELSLLFRREATRGYRRALDLLRRHKLTEAEVQTLVERVELVSSFEDPEKLELQLALAAQSSPMRDRLRAEILLREKPTPLALGLLRRSLKGPRALPVSGALMRRARFAAGQHFEAIEAWLEALPEVVLEQDGLPKDERLAAIIRSSRVLSSSALNSSDPSAWSDLGGALLDAGWFEEARSLAASLATHDLDMALDLDRRAMGGREFLKRLDRVTRSFDEDGAERANVYLPFEPSAESDVSSAWQESSAWETHAAVPTEDSLDGFLSSLLPLFARARSHLPRLSVVDQASQSNQAWNQVLLGSSQVQHGFIGSLLHPGPEYSRLDQREKRGKNGVAVPGFAAAMDSLGRFAVYGKVLGGGGVDGTVLQRVSWAFERGEHLGVPWEGTVVWCEGVDVLSRAGRAGAQISGAAVHEGYWIDLDRVRLDYAIWKDLEQRLLDPEQGPLLESALATRGLKLPEQTRGLERRRERRRTGPLLGSSELLRLAVLCERRDQLGVEMVSQTVGQAPSGDLMSLDELAALTATHEEGHLCDRSRFLPLGRNLGAVLGLLAKNSFSPGRLAERLEYRAQLTALCEVIDPRVPLVDILRAAEFSNGLTPHAAGYAEILEDILLELDRRVEAEPTSWSMLDPDRMLVHQLHTLNAEQVRGLARAVARREGLVED